jgi:hypothetical protein
MPKRKAKEKKIYNSNKYKAKQLFIIAVVLVCTLTFVATFGRYVVNTINNFFVRTKEFYFYSDKLSENSSYYQIDNWTGVDPYTITVNMNSRLNNIKVTTYDIDYDISYRASENCSCQLSKEAGTILASSNSDYFNLTIIPNTGLTTGDKVWVVITATSNAQYKKTLTATFVLTVGKENLSYEIKDEAQSKYLELNITNTLSYYKVSEAFESYNVDDRIDVDTYLNLSDENKAKCYSALITLKFDPNIVLLDMTNTNYLNATQVSKEVINGSNYINGITFKVDPISSAVVRFYKLDVSQDYTYPIVNDTSIIELTSK